MQIFVKSIIGIILIPFVLGLLISFWKLITSLLPLSSSEIWFLSGFAIFFVIFLVKPLPNKLYIFGHELTHAFWAILFRARVKEFNVRSKTGNVLITKSNFLISLAPYFFPIYTFLIIFIFYILVFFFDVSKYIEWLFFFVGISYSFHIFLNFESLSIGQSDVKKTGKLFSYIVIVILNIIIAVVVLKFISPEKITLKKYFFESWTVALIIYKFVWKYLTELYNLI
ncbi:MAG TPA: hypothetical protein DCX95_07365 [Elusimicrobia bacterium]|nr:hypothetical protein [Elusimicrobiota bacterium]